MKSILHSARITVFSLLLARAQSRAQTDQAIYTDSLQNGWQNWSWATVNLANSSPVEAGTKSISVSSTNWQALYFHHTAQDASPFGSISFWVHGGSTGGQHIRVQATRNQVAQTNLVELAPLPANSWRQDSVSLAALGVAGVTDFDGFWLQACGGITGCQFCQLRRDVGCGDLVLPDTRRHG